MKPEWLLKGLKQLMNYQFVFCFFSEGELLTLPEEERNRADHFDPGEINEQHELQNNARTEFMPREFFQIRRNVQLPDVVRQVEEIEELGTHTWAPGGEPNSENKSE